MNRLLCWNKVLMMMLFVLFIYDDDDLNLIQRRSGSLVCSVSFSLSHTHTHTHTHTLIIHLLSFFQNCLFSQSDWVSSLSLCQSHCPVHCHCHWTVAVPPSHTVQSLSQVSVTKWHYQSLQEMDGASFLIVLVQYCFLLGSSHVCMNYEWKVTVSIDHLFKSVSLEKLYDVGSVHFIH